MRQITCIARGAMLTILAIAPGCQAQIRNADEQVALAVLPAPDEMRDGASVLGYDNAGKLVTLRGGSNDLICLADDPGDDRFQTSCYHKSLGPYMARGRALRSQDLSGAESIEKRHEEAIAGTLKMPTDPAAVYNVYGSLEDFNPETAEVGLHAVYIPYATETSTGLPDTPGPPGTPWIMRAGTPSAHIMIVAPDE